MQSCFTMPLRDPKSVTSPTKCYPPPDPHPASSQNNSCLSQAVGSIVPSSLAHCAGAHSSRPTPNSSACERLQSLSLLVVGLLVDDSAVSALDVECNRGLYLRVVKFSEVAVLYMVDFVE
jgi:hypothetical protein